MMSNHDKMNELKKEKLALEEKMSALRVISVLEGGERCSLWHVGKSTNKDWFSVTTHRKKNAEDSHYSFMEQTSLNGNPSMELRMELAKVFRKFYGLEEKNDYII